MSTVIHRRRGPKLRNGVDRVVIADVEPGIASRFSPREDLVRVSLDLVNDIDGLENCDVPANILN